MPRTSSVSRTGGSRRPSWWISVASAGIEPGAAPPTSAWWARLATQPDEPAVDVARRHEGDVVEVGAAGERVVDHHLLAGRDAVAEGVDGGRAPTPASSRGGPGCARPGPAARRRG